MTALPENALATRRRLAMQNGAGYFASHFIEGKNPHDPDAKLIEQDPGTTNRAHFHQVNQFQVFVRGSARLGKSETGPVVVHYAGAYTPYGPIVSGDGGIHYFTLRQHVDPGIRHIPEGLRDMKRVPRRYFVSRRWQGEAEPPPPEGGCRETFLIGPEPDGIEAVMVRLAEGARWQGQPDTRRAERYMLVIAGSVCCDGHILSGQSCMFAGAGEPLPAMNCVSGPADFIVMQFPHSQ